ncbi:hypothetical protein ACFL2Y_04880 [Candidatus Omnitrophota bacterium]
MKKLSEIFVLVFIFSILFSLLYSYAEERITLTTYYPAPYGVYREMRVNGLAVGSAYRNNPTDITDGYLLVNGSVGIGTTNPGDTLHVLSSIEVGQAGILSGDIYSDGDFSLGIDADGNTNIAAFKFKKDTTDPNGAGTELVRIQENGNVGIGTTSPGAMLSFGDLNDGRNTADGITWYNPEPLWYGIYRSAGPWSGNYQQLILSWSTGIVIDGGDAYGRSGTVLQPTDGNVGIGTTNPTAKLQVAGQYNSVKHTSGVAVNWNNGNVQYIQLSSGAQALTFANPADGGRYLLILKQPASGAPGTVSSWPSAVRWPTGAIPILTLTNGKVDIITLMYNYDGTNGRYYCGYLQDYSS